MSKICLIGSTRFKDEYEKLNKEFSLRGHIVYGVACYGQSGERLTDEDRMVLEAVHLRKIVESDVVFVINQDGYIGESTRREIYFAKIMGKEIRFLVQDDFAQVFTRVNFRTEFRPCPPVP